MLSWFLILSALLSTARNAVPDDVCLTHPHILRDWVKGKERMTVRKHNLCCIIKFANPLYVYHTFLPKGQNSHLGLLFSSAHSEENKLPHFESFLMI
jgi:hypothetical protein